MHKRAAEFFAELQCRICAALEAADGAVRFEEDCWQRDGGGGGRTRVLADGGIFERAGVNWSEVHGEIAPALSGQIPGSGDAFFASGVSLVLHPHSPMIPTVHANFRVIQRGEHVWFGGGADLTPYYPWREDAVHFHQVFKQVCERHDPDWYPRFKAWCDGYFYLPHRQETRGIGGIFYDYLGLRKDQLPTSASPSHRFALEEAVDKERAFAFVRDAGESFIEAYLPIVERRRDQEWGERERDFQLLRRGRYVEFNLLYDRGTQFGLHTSGRTESILMSLPPYARWEYDHHPVPGSREAELEEYLSPQDWLAA